MLALESPRPRPSALVDRAFLACLILAGVGACATARPAVLGPLTDPGATAGSLRSTTRLAEPARIDFTWQLNEAGSRASGVGVARIEPPYRARLDLFLDNGESVVSAALVDDELRLPPGAPHDVLPPVELMWGTLGVFRPMTSATLVGGDRLEQGGERLRYRHPGGEEVHFELVTGGVRALELVEGSSVVQWVRLGGDPQARYPESATYRNLVDYRELKITRTSAREVEPFDPAIFDPRQ